MDDQQDVLEDCMNPQLTLSQQEINLLQVITEVVGCLLLQHNLVQPDKYFILEVSKKPGNKYSRPCGPDGLLYSSLFCFVYNSYKI